MNPFGSRVCEEMLQFLEEYSEAEKNGGRNARNKTMDRFATNTAKLVLQDIQKVTDPSSRLEAAFLSAVAVLFGNQAISGIVGQNLHQWFVIFYDDLASERALPQSGEASMMELSWDLVGQFLAAGFLDKAKALLVTHPLLQRDEEAVARREYDQGEILMEFIGLIESRPILSTLMDVESSSCGVPVETQDFVFEFAKWRDNDLTSFDSLISKNRSMLGDHLTDVLLDMEEILSGKDEILRKYTLNKVDLFFGRLFHDPHWIHNHLQLRISFESIAGKTGPLFSTWNPSLYALMKDLFTMEGLRLCEYVADSEFGFDVCSRLSMGLILRHFFEEHQAFWITPRPSLEASFLDHYGDQFCSKLTHFDEVIKFVLFCHGLSKQQAINLLNKATLRNQSLSRSLLEMTQTDDFDTKWVPLMDSAGLLSTLKTLIGKAHHMEGNISLAAYSLKNCSLPDAENIALADSKALFLEILTLEKDIFCSAVKIEILNIEELLNTGLQRRQSWTEMNAELKVMSNLKTNLNKALLKVEPFTRTRTHISKEGLYGLLTALSKLLHSLPKENNRILNTERLHGIEGVFEEVLDHTCLDPQMEFLVAMKALNVFYLFGSHLPGSSIFSTSFSKRVVRLVANRSLLIGLGDARVTLSIQQMLCSIVETIKQ